MTYQNLKLKKKEEENNHCHVWENFELIFFFKIFLKTWLLKIALLAISFANQWTGESCFSA